MTFWSSRERSVRPCSWCGSAPPSGLLAKITRSLSLTSLGIVWSFCTPESKTTTHRSQRPTISAPARWLSAHDIEQEQGQRSTRENSSMSVDKAVANALAGSIRSASLSSFAAFSSRSRLATSCSSFCSKLNTWPRVALSPGHVSPGRSHVAAGQRGRIRRQGRSLARHPLATRYPRSRLTPAWSCSGRVFPTLEHALVNPCSRGPERNPQVPRPIPQEPNTYGVPAHSTTGRSLTVSWSLEESGSSAGARDRLTLSNLVCVESGPSAASALDDLALSMSGIFCSMWGQVAGEPRIATVFFAEKTRLQV
eukprot:2127203-Rhodomonas_salina.2